MEKILRQWFLYDFYGELLTEHQKNIYEEHVLNDVGLSEIASEMGVSRQSVHDLVKRCDNILEGYETKLKLIDKFMTAKAKVKKIHDITKQFDLLDISDDERKLINNINELSNEILEEM